MSQLTRWDPFHELEDMHNRLTSIFSRTPTRRDRETITVADWAPIVDITEDEKAYIIKAELPEVKKDQVKVTMENGMLTLAGERKLEKEEKGRKYHRVERSYGSFLRSFTLPDDADPEKINASHKDGVLTITVAKTEQAKPRAIEVKVT